MARGESPAAGESTAARRERFERLTSPHVPSLYRTAFYLTGRRERAEDALQETYLRAWRYFDTFDPAREAKAWLFAILRNVIYAEARARKREPHAASLEEMGSEQIAGPTSEAPSSRASYREIVASMERLPEEFRAVVLLALVEGFKYHEIAGALEIPIGTVMSRLHRGRQLLHERLRAYLGKGDGGTAKA